MDSADAFFHIYSTIVIEEGKDHEFDRESGNHGNGEEL